MTPTWRVCSAGVRTSCCATRWNGSRPRRSRTPATRRSPPATQAPWRWSRWSPPFSRSATASCRCCWPLSPASRGGSSAASVMGRTSQMGLAMLPGPVLIPPRRWPGLDRSSRSPLRAGSTSLRSTAGPRVTTGAAALIWVWSGLSWSALEVPSCSAASTSSAKGQWPRSTSRASLLATIPCAPTTWAQAAPTSHPHGSPFTAGLEVAGSAPLIASPAGWRPTTSATRKTRVVGTCSSCRLPAASSDLMLAPHRGPAAPPAADFSQRSGMVWAIGSTHSCGPPGSSPPRQSATVATSGSTPLMTRLHWARYGKLAVCGLAVAVSLPPLPASPVAQRP